MNGARIRASNGIEVCVDRLVRAQQKGTPMSGERCGGKGVTTGGLALAIGMAAGAVFLGGMLMAMTQPAGAQAAGTALAQPSETPIRPSRPLITAAGQATVTRKPDRAVVNVGVQVTGASMAATTDALNKRVEAATKAIKALALPGMVVQTQWLNVQPQYNWQAQGEGREPKITGYQGATTLRVQVDAPEQAGKIVDALVGADGNVVQGIGFELNDQTDADSEALAKATVDARRKAEVMAGALGLRIIGVLEARTGVHGPVTRMEGAPMLAAAKMRGAAPTPVETGEVEVSAEVTVIFEAGK